MSTDTRPATRPDVGRPPWCRRAAALLREVRDRAREEQVSLLASAVAFWGFLSLFPAVLAGLTVYGLVADPSTVQATVTRLFGAFSPESQGVLTRVLRGVTAGGSALTWGLALSVAGLLWSSSSVTAYLLRAASLAAGQEPRRSWRSRLLALPVTLGFLVVASAAVGGVAVLPPVLRALGLGAAATVGGTVAGYAAVVTLLVGSATLLYAYGPHEGGPRLRESLLGALLAAGLWLFGSVGFTLYVGSLGSYGATYAGLGGVVVVLLWLYLSAVAVVLGMVVAGVLDRRRTGVDPYPT